MGQGLVYLINSLGFEVSVETQDEPLAASVARDAENFIGHYDAKIRQVEEQISVGQSIIKKHEAIIKDQQETNAAREAEKARLERNLKALEDEP